MSQQTLYNDLVITGAITGNSIVKAGGTSSQFLKADGSVDTNTYSLNTHGHSDATTSVSGFMSAADKSKLAGIVDDAFGDYTAPCRQASDGMTFYVVGATNDRNKYKDSTDIYYVEYTGTCWRVGEGGSIYSDSVPTTAQYPWEATWSSGLSIVKVTRGVVPTNHRHPVAQQYMDGFMSSADKIKLDGIPNGVNYGVVTNAFPAAAGTAIANINWQAGTYWSGSLGAIAGTTIQFQNVIAGKTIILSITGTGNPVAWPSGITWLSGSAPSLTVSGQTRIVKILATSVSTFIGAVDTI